MSNGKSWFVMSLVFGVLAIISYPRRDQPLQPSQPVQPYSQPAPVPATPPPVAAVPLASPAQTPEPTPTPEPVPPPPPPTSQVKFTGTPGGSVFSQSWAVDIFATSHQEWQNTPMHVEREAKLVFEGDRKSVV